MTDQNLVTAEYAAAFDQMIAHPLQHVVGKRLRSVDYFILWGGFDAETPNHSGGCQGVLLAFDESMVELDWAWEAALRDGVGGIAHHLIVRDQSIRQQGVREWTADDISGLNRADAGHTRLWSRVIGQPLLRVEVSGLEMPDSRYSPQTVELHFPESSIVIGVGMTDHQDVTIQDIGDGDEILVFSEEEWESLPSSGIRGSNPLTRFWSWPLGEQE